MKTAKRAKKPATLIEVIGDVALVPLDPRGFEALPLEKKILAFHLGEAAWAGDRIMFDQRYAHNLAIRDLITEIVTHGKGLPRPLARKMRDYLVRLYIHHGVHDGWSRRKFTPGFTPAELEKAAKLARKAGAGFCASRDDCLPGLLAELHKPIFDPDFEALITVKDPPPGEDILTASFNNLYSGVSVADLKSFKEKNPLNSKLVKRGGKLEELVYRAGGTVDVLDGKDKPTGKTITVAPGLYATELTAIIGHLEAALPYADAPQAEAFRWLIRYYRTGDLADFRRYNIAWVGHGPMVETINGFVEVYIDARGAKGSFEGVVAFVDEPATKIMRALSENAAWLEKKMPWKEAYKKSEFSPPVANAFNVLVETGDGGPLSWSGINLPNAQEIREKYGHKNFLLTNVMAAYRAAHGFKSIDEFAWSKKEAALAKRCYEHTGRAKVALHEVTGHGSGKVSGSLTKDPHAYLKEYYSTLEEARADLVALWLAHDPKIVELGVLPEASCADALYDGFVRGFPLRLRRIPTGDVIEEDHLRAGALIIGFAVEKGAVTVSERAGKIYIHVVDHAKMREAVGELLAELMRIKAEGDYAAIKKLVTKYATKMDTRWRDDATRRANKLKLPVLTAVMPVFMDPVTEGGKIIDVKVRMARTKADVTRHALRAGSIPVPPARTPKLTTR